MYVQCTFEVVKLRYIRIKFVCGKTKSVLAKSLSDNKLIFQHYLPQFLPNKCLTFEKKEKKNHLFETMSNFL